MNVQMLPHIYLHNSDDISHSLSNSLSRGECTSLLFVRVQIKYF